MSVSVPVLARTDARIALGRRPASRAPSPRRVAVGRDGRRPVGHGRAALRRAGRRRGRDDPRSPATRGRSRARCSLGSLGALVLCVPAALRHADGVMPVSPLGGYLPWALGVVVVAVAEEALLRGSLFAAIDRRAGTAAAIGVTSLAFALLHVPLYGWGVVPLDLAVGVWLGALRATTGSVTAPALAHALADLAGWWLR